VHEGRRASRRAAGAGAQGGHDLHKRAGYYKTGEYGIRIENLVVVREARRYPRRRKKMLGFETITMAPIDLALVECSDADRGRNALGSTPITRKSAPPLPPPSRNKRKDLAWLGAGNPRDL
jgi:Xaa-Pro aminopeptidase